MRFNTFGNSEEEFSLAYDNLNKFYNSLKARNKYGKSANVDFDFKNIIYREGQRNLSFNIMDAIRNRSALLVEAPVGFGKSYAYLLPIFYTIDNVKKFKKVIISTSSIVLQQQLLTDINNVSKLLGIDISVSIAKGIGNYACLKKIQEMPSNRELDKKALIDAILEKGSADRSDFMEIADSVWESIKRSNRGICSNCSYSRKCPNRRIEEEIRNSSIVITNHQYLANYIDKSSNSDVSENDLVVVDEVHLFEDAVRSITYKELTLKNINEIINSLGNDYSWLKNDFKNLFIDIKNSANNSFRNNRKFKIMGIKKKDCKELPFNIKNVKNKIIKILNSIKRIKFEYENISRNSMGRISKKDRKALEELEMIEGILKDMIADDSKNIYWANFINKNKISIGYCNKSIENITSKLFDNDIPVVMTSATMNVPKQGYSLIKSGLGIKYATEVKPYDPVFDLENRSLFYYDSSMPNPNSFNYNEELAIRIDNIIRKTGGRCLILFTSVNSLEYVKKELIKYDRIKPYEFPLYFQGDDDNYSLQQKFEEDSKSCLFGTGFWVGLDVKGRSLCNVIVTRLPYDVVSPVNVYKNSLSGDDFYYNNMIIKLRQGMGRLLRSNKDFGTIYCLDPRIEKFISGESYFLGYPVTESLDDCLDLNYSHIPGRRPRN